MKRPKSLSEVSKEWIESIPKTVNDNGCWLPLNKPGSGGYVKIYLGRRDYKLHRLAMSVYYNIDYYAKDTVTRHAAGCDKACFFHSHLTPGSDSDNMQDEVLRGEHYNTAKENCPVCGGYYTKYRTMHIGKMRWQRYCRICKTRNDRERRKGATP